MCIWALSIWTYKKAWSNRCNFFKICQKNYKCWIKCISKKITTIGSANTCNFFGNEKNLISKKITTMGSKHNLNPTLVFLFQIDFFSFPKKITSVDWSMKMSDENAEPGDCFFTSCFFMLTRLKWLVIKIVIYHTFFQMSLFTRNMNDLQLFLLLLQVWTKEMEMIHRLFLVITIYWNAVGSNSLEITYVLFEFSYSKLWLTQKVFLFSNLDESKVRIVMQSSTDVWVC